MYSDIPINVWPVSSINQSYLDDIKATHVVHRIPAYDIRNQIIAPDKYQDKLAGSIVEVYFSLVHFFIRQSQKNIFNAVVRDITVLRPPLQVASSISGQKLHSVLHNRKKGKTHD